MLNSAALTVVEDLARSTIRSPWSDTSSMHDCGLQLGLSVILRMAWHNTELPLCHIVSTEPMYPKRNRSRFTLGVAESKSVYSTSTAYADGNAPWAPVRRLTPKNSTMRIITIISWYYSGINIGVSINTSVESKQ